MEDEENTVKATKRLSMPVMLGIGAAIAFVGGLGSILSEPSSPSARRAPVIKSDDAGQKAAPTKIAEVTYPRGASETEPYGFENIRLGMTLQEFEGVQRIFYKSGPPTYLSCDDRRKSLVLCGARGGGEVHLDDAYGAITFEFEPIASGSEFKLHRIIFRGERDDFGLTMRALTSVYGTDSEIISAGGERGPGAVPNSDMVLWKNKSSRIEFRTRFENQDQTGVVFILEPDAPPTKRL